MKKSFLIKVLSLIVAVTAVFGLVGINANVVDANSVTTTFAVKDGARISTTSVANVSALRFEADIYQADYDEAVNAANGETVYFGIQVKRAGSSSVVADSCYTGSKVGNGVTIVPTFADASAPYTMYNKITFNANDLREYLLTQPGIDESNVDNAVTAYLAQAYTMKLEAQAYYKIGATGEKVFCGPAVQRSFHTVAYATQLLLQAGKVEFPELPENFFEQYTISVEEGEIYFSTAELGENGQPIPQGFDLLANKIVDFTSGESAKTLNGVTVNVDNYGSNFSATYAFGAEFFADESRALGKRFNMFAFSADKKVYELSAVVANRLIDNEQEFVDFVQVDADYDSTGYTVLTNHLDLTGYAINHTSLVKTSGTPGFSGTFDGFGHTIDNFDATKSVANVTDKHGRTNHLGLFGALGATAVIKNFALTNVFASYSLYIAGYGAPGSQISDLFIDIRPETYMPLGLFEEQVSGQNYSNIVIHYPAYHDTLQGFAYGAMASYGVLTGNFMAYASKSNVYVISPSALYKQYSAVSNIHSFFVNNSYANNAADGFQDIDTILQAPVYAEDGVTIIGGRKVKYSSDVSTNKFKQKDYLGYWDEETKTFTFDNSIYEYGTVFAHGTNCSVDVVQQFADYNQFKNSPSDHTGKEAAAFNVYNMNSDYWQIVDGVPFFKNLNASNNAYLSNVTLNGQVDNYTITTTNDYAFTLQDSFGNNVEDFTVTSSNEELLVANGKTVRAITLPINPTPVKVTLTANVNGATMKKDIVVILKATTTVVEDKIYYSEFDSKLENVSTLGINGSEITAIYFVDHNNVLQELSYDASTQKLTGIQLRANAPSLSFSGLNVTVTYKNDETYSFKLGATDGTIETGMKFVVTTSTGVYELNNVIPAYKAINEESEIDLSQYLKVDDYTGSTADTFKFRYFVLISDIVSNGSYVGSSANAKWGTCAFDGAGHSLVNFNITKNSLLGLGYIENGAVANLAVMNVTAKNANVITNSEARYITFRNIYCEFNANSVGSAFIGSTHYGMHTHNLIIVDNTSENTSTYTFARSLGDNAFASANTEISDNTYLITKHLFPNTSLGGVTLPRDTMNNCNVDDCQLNGNYYYDDTAFYDKRNYVERYNTYSDFISSNSNFVTFTNESGAKYWTILNGVPTWKRYYASQNQHAFKEISITANDVKQTSEYLITEVGVGYEVKLVDNYGYEQTNFELSTNSDILVANGKVLTLTQEVQAQQVVEVTVSGEVNGDAYQFIFNVKLDALTILNTNKFYYSQFDKKLLIDSLGLENITAVYYVDNNDLQHQLKYDVDSGELTGIVTKTVHTTNNGKPVLSGEKVSIFYNGNETETASSEITLSSDGSIITGSIELAVIAADGSKYLFTNVVPVYKTIDDERELDLDIGKIIGKENSGSPKTAPLYQYYVMTSNIVSTGAYHGWVLNDSDPEGVAAYGSKDYAWTSARTHYVFDGDGHYIKDISLTSTYGLFGYYQQNAIYTNFALYNLKTNSNYSSHGIFGPNPRYIYINNVYIDISPNGPYRGIYDSLTTYTAHSFRTNNLIINYPVAENTGTYMLDGSLGDSTYPEDITNSYFISKNYVTRQSLALTPEGGTAEAKKTYILETYNNKTEEFTEKCTAGGKTYYRKPDTNVIVSESFPFKRYNTLVDFANATGNDYSSFTNEATGYGNWTIYNGMPVFNGFVEVNINNFVSDIKVLDSEGKVLDTTDLDKLGDYSFKIYDLLGKELTNYTISTNNDKYVSYDGKTLKVNSLPTYGATDGAFEVTFTINANGTNVVKTISLNVKASAIVHSKDVIYSQVDNKLMLANTGIKEEEISKICYVDAEGGVHELKYSNGELTGITTVTTASQTGIVKQAVSIFYKDNDTETPSVSLDLKANTAKTKIADRIKLAVFVNDEVYELTSVLPVYQAIDEEAELNIEVANNRYYMMVTDFVSDGTFKGTTRFITTSQAEQPNRVPWSTSRQHVVFDGNGHYVKDLVIANPYGMFGGYAKYVVLQNFALYNVKVEKSHSSSTGYGDPILLACSQGVFFNNIYIDLDPTSVTSGIAYTTTSYDTVTGYVANNLIVNYQVAENNGKGIFGPIAYATNLNAVNNTYVLSKNYLTTIAGKITPNGGTEEETSKEYIVDAYNVASTDETFTGSGKITNYGQYVSANSVSIIYNEDAKILASSQYPTKRYETYIDFAKATGNDFTSFTSSETGNGCWSIYNGVPVFNGFIEVMGEKFISKVEIVDSNDNAVEASNVNKLGNYSFKLYDMFGNDIANYTIAIDNEKYATTNGEVISVNNIPAYGATDGLTNVTITATINNETLVAIIPVTITADVRKISKDVIYSEADTKLMLASTGINVNEISNVYYHAGNELKELNFADGLLTGITTRTECNYDYSALLSKHSVSIFYKGNETETADVSLNLAINTTTRINVDGRISMLVVVGDVYYELLNVLPVYKAIDEEAELNIAPQNYKYYILTTDIVSDGTFTGNTDVKTTRSNAVFDGDGHYIKDVVLSQAKGLFGGGTFNNWMIKDVAFYNLTNNSANAPLILHNPRIVEMHNIYLDINPNSLSFSGFFYDYSSYSALKGWVMNNVIVNYPVATRNNNYVLSPNIVYPTTFASFTNTYVLTKNSLARYTGAFTPTGGTAETSATYEIIPYHKATGFTEAGTFKYSYGGSERTQSVLRNADKTAITNNTFTLKHYDDFASFISATGNNYTSFTGNAGYGCWELQGGVPVWKGYTSVMTDSVIDITISKPSEELVTNKLDEVGQYSIEGVAIDGVSTVSDVIVTCESKYITCTGEDNTFTVNNLPLEGDVVYLNVTANVYGITFYKTFALEIAVKPIIVNDQIVYEESSSSLLLGSTGIDYADIDKVYYVDAEGKEHALDYQAVIDDDGETINGYALNGISSILASYTKSNVTILDANGEEHLVELALSNYNYTTALKLKIVTSDNIYDLSNVIPAYLTIDSISKLINVRDKGPDLNTSDWETYSKKYITFTSDLVGDSTTDIASSKNIGYYFGINNTIVNGNGHYITGVVLGSGSGEKYGLFGGYFHSAALTSLAVLDVKVNNSSIFSGHNRSSIYDNLYVTLHKDSTNVFGLAIGTDYGGFNVNNCIIDFTNVTTPFDRASNALLAISKSFGSPISQPDFHNKGTNSYILGEAYLSRTAALVSGVTSYLDCYNQRDLEVTYKEFVGGTSTNKYLGAEVPEVVYIANCKYARYVDQDAFAGASLAFTTYNANVWDTTGATPVWRNLPQA